MKSTIKWQTGIPTETGDYLVLIYSPLPEVKPRVDINYWRASKWQTQSLDKGQVVAWCKLTTINTPIDASILHRIIFLLCAIPTAVILGLSWIPAFIIAAVIGAIVCYVWDGTGLFDCKWFEKIFIDIGYVEIPIKWLHKKIVYENSLLYIIQRSS